MTPEDKELLLKDLSSRLPYKIKVSLFGWDKFPCTVTKIDIKLKKIFCPEANCYQSIDVIKPYLRPVSSMTEEEFKMVCSMNALTDTELRDRINFPNMFVKSYTIETFDLFNSHHFDYRGLIEKSLAIVAPEGMYKNE